MKKPNATQQAHTCTYGFTLVELVIVIVVIALLSSVALARFASITSAARGSNLEGIAGSMRTTIALVRSQARLLGLTPAASNPGAGQSRFVIESELGLAELDWRNLCPESSAELGDALDMSDYLALNLTNDLNLEVNNQFTRIGYEITNSSGAGCYLVYDSFGFPDCTVDVVDVDC